MKDSNVASTGLEGVKKTVTPTRKGSVSKTTGKDIRTGK